jgi:hypothetical protein
MVDCRVSIYDQNKLGGLMAARLAFNAEILQDALRLVAASRLTAFNIRN